MIGNSIQRNAFEVMNSMIFDPKYLEYLALGCCMTKSNEYLGIQCCNLMT